jgi:hypothetical protein
LVVRLAGAEDDCAASDVCDRVVFDVVFDDELDAREPPLADCDSSCVASFSLPDSFSLDELLEDSSEWLLE